MNKSYYDSVEIIPTSFSGRKAIVFCTREENDEFLPVCSLNAGNMKTNLN